MSMGCPLCGAAIADDGRILVDIEGGLIVSNGRVAQLTKQEFAVFEAMWLSRPLLRTKEQLLDAVYGLLPSADAAEIKIIDVFVCKIRKKLEGMDVPLETVWGRGYRILTPGQHPDTRAAAAGAGGSTLQEVA